MGRFLDLRSFGRGRFRALHLPLRTLIAGCRSKFSRKVAVLILRLRVLSQRHSSPTAETSEDGGDNTQSDESPRTNLVSRMQDSFSEEWKLAVKDSADGLDVSIIIAAHNAGDYITEAVSSAMQTSGVTFEVIVVDDASCDDTAQRLRKLSTKFVGLRVLNQKTNQGAFVSRNIGIQASRAKFISFLDSDDVQDPNRLTNQIKALQTSSSAIVSYCQSRRWTEDWANPLTSQNLCFISSVFPKALIQEVGFFDSVRWGGDAEFRSRIVANFGHEAIIDLKECLYRARFREGSLTSSGQSKMLYLDSGELRVQLSQARNDYRRNFAKWHRRGAQLHIDFPLSSRPFPLGAPSQAP